VDYVKAEMTRAMFTAGWSALFEQVDCVLAPVLAATPPPIAEPSTVTVNGQDAGTLDAFQPASPHRRTWRAFRRSRFPAGSRQADCRSRFSSWLRPTAKTSCSPWGAWYPEADQLAHSAAGIGTLHLRFQIPDFRFQIPDSQSGNLNSGIWNLE
jgi:hypothetical protein